MKYQVLLIGVALLGTALWFHFLAQANVITKIEKSWFERLFSGNRASNDNLNEEGKRHRKHSNLCAVGGLLMIGFYVFLSAAN